MPGLQQRNENSANKMLNTTDWEKMSNHSPHLFNKIPKSFLKLNVFQ